MFMKAGKRVEGMNIRTIEKKKLKYNVGESVLQPLGFLIRTIL